MLEVAMQYQEMILGVWELLGKRTDLRPVGDDSTIVDLSLGGAIKLGGWVNRGYKTICSWKTRRGRIIRFRNMEKTYMFPGVIKTGTAVGGTVNTIMFPAAFDTTVNRYQKWIIEITAGTGIGQSRLIVGYSALRVATVHKSWDTIPDATSVFKVTKNFMMYLDAGHVLADENIPLGPTEVVTAMGVVDLESASELVRGSRTIPFLSVLQDIAPPSVFKDEQNGIYFNSAFYDQRYYELRYFGPPPSLVELTDVPVIPDRFHDCIVMWAVWWGLLMFHEPTMAYSMRRNVEDMMEQIVEQWDMTNEKDNVSLYVEETR
jgi:hypothetical protein